MPHHTPMSPSPNHLDVYLGQWSYRRALGQNSSDTAFRETAPRLSDYDCSDEANLPQPAVQILPHEFVVRQFRIAGAHPVDLLQLSGREVLRGVEAPAPRQQALPPQNLVE